MSKEFIAMFPGQGSQKVGMGKSFYDNHSVAKEIFEIADNALGYSLSEMCFEGPIEELTLTQNAQPAILTVSYIAYSLFSKIPVAAAGHSLGEYSALVAAESISFEDAVLLVHKRGKYMQEAVPRGQGSMVAIMGPGPEEIKTVVSNVKSGVVEVANYNCPGQTVVAGSVDGVAEFSELMKAAGGKVIPLQVSAPFHCSLMKPAAEKLAADLDAITVNAPNFPVYANVTATKVKDANEVRQLLKDQVCSSVRWTETMQNMIADLKVTNAVEFGPGGVLSKLLKRTDKSVAAIEISENESLQKAE